MLLIKNIRRPWTPERTNIQTTKKTDPFYLSKSWRVLRKEKINETPYCEYCEIITQAKVVDHVLPRSLFPELELKKQNLRSCCDKCHNKKRGIERHCKNRQDALTKLKNYIS